MDILSQLHPKLVHFPIALFTIYALLEVIGSFLKKDFTSKTAYLILFLGMLGAVAAVLTGNSAADAVHKLGGAVPQDAIGSHVDYANFTMWYFAGLLVLRTFVVLKKNFSGSTRYWFAALAIVGVFLVYRTGELGGRLVYKYGAGTEFMKKGNTPGQDSGSYRDKIFKGKHEQ